MRYNDSKTGHYALWMSTGASLAFLLVPLLFIFIYAFTTDDRTFQFPPPGYTLKWFSVAWNNRPDIWQPLYLSLRVAAMSTVIGVVLGTLAAGALSRAAFYGRDTVSLLFVVPLILPGIVMGMALRSSISFAGVDYSTWTIVIGHATFCIAIVFNNAIARFRRLGVSMLDASADLGGNGWQTLRYVILPQIAPAMLAGAMLAFALSFDEVVVTTFTAGQQSTLPIWMLNELIRPRQRPITNVVAIIVVGITLMPLLLAFYVTNRANRDS